ncbi:unnamed protein product [Penicillium salamii]|nr:unnamed protein product [Penicillium salamii]
MDSLLKSLWASVLEINEHYVEEDDNFFEVGGNSIIAVRLAAAAEKIGMSLPVTDIFRYPEFSEMAKVIKMSESHSKRDTGPFQLMESSGMETTEILQQISNVHPEINQFLIEDVYPSTPLQAGLMVVSTRQQGSYISQFVFRVPTATDLESFQKAWDQVVEVVDTPRTRMVNLSNPAGCFQVIVKEKIRWHKAVGLQDYLQKDKSTAMGFGDPLVRFAIVSDATSNDLHFVWTIHHCIWDRWSVDLLWQKVASVYHGADKGSIKAPKYSGFVAHVLNANTFDHENFWKSRLSNINTKTFPPLPYQSYQPKTSASSKYSTTISRRGSSEVTISSIIQAAWALTVGKHSDCEDVIFGTVLIGRDTPAKGITEVLGPTIATVPIRAHLDYARNAEEYLKEVQVHATDVIPFEHMGLSSISKLNEDTKAACQFQNLLVIQPHKTGAHPLQWSQVKTHQAEAHPYGLVVECTLGADQDTLEIEVYFDPHLLSNMEVDNVAHHFQQAITSLNGKSTKQLLGDIEISCPNDESNIASWNMGATSNPVDACIHEIFQQTVQQQPDAQAICSWDGTLSYRKLDELSTKLAQSLAGCYGVGPETCVPLCFEKSYWSVVATIAVLKAGGTFVPLDASHPQTRLCELVKDVKSRVVLSSPRFSNLFTESVTETVLSIDEQHFDQLQIPRDDFEVGYANASGIAYIIYTSGSTGKPKGTMVEHGAFLSSWKGFSKSISMSKSSRVLQFTSNSFDASLVETLSTVLCGGCICIPSEDEKFNSLPQAMTRMMVNWMLLVPSFARILDPASLPHLKTIVLGGEAASENDFTRWITQGAHVINAYGPTECSVISTSNMNVEPESDPSNIGKVTCGSCWVVDKNNHNRLAPVGCPGELLLEGPHLARGYVHNDAATSAAFVQSPTWGKGRRFYKTGDIVRQRMDGSLSFLGRKDMQVKLRGQRLELPEIEHQIKRYLGSEVHVAVEIATVKIATVNSSVAGEEQSQHLVAFVLPTQGLLLHSADANVSFEVWDGLQNKLIALKDHLKQALPFYMVPAVYIPLKRAPAMVSGKLDRGFFRKILQTFSNSQLQSFTPTNQEEKQSSQSWVEDGYRGFRERPQPIIEDFTTMERQIHQLWAQALSIEPSTIGKKDNFFRIGGDSIVAMRLVGLARAQGLGIKVSDIFEHRQLDILAEVLVGKQVAHETYNTKPFSLLDQGQKSLISETYDVFVKNGKTVDILPVTGAQAILLKMFGLGCFSFFIKGRICPDRMRSACESVVQSHSSLRTVYLSYKESFLQAIIQSIDVPFEHIRTSVSLKSTCQSLCDSYVLENAASGKSIVKFAMVSQSDDEHVLIMRLTHAQYDGASYSIILDDLATAYNDGGVSPPARTSFSEFAYYCAGHRTNSAFDFWKYNLLGSTMTMPPGAPSHPGLSVADVHEIAFGELPPALEDITTPALVNAAFALVLADLVQSDDVTFAMFMSTRDIGLPGAQEIIGPCINLNLLRVKLDRSRSVLDLCHTLRDQYTQVSKHGHLDLPEIIAKSTDWPSDSKLRFIVNHLGDDDSTPRPLEGGATLSNADGTHRRFLDSQAFIRCVAKSDGLQVHVVTTSVTMSSKQAGLIARRILDTVKMFTEYPDTILASLCTPKAE